MGGKTGIMLDYIGSGVSDHSDSFSFSLKAHAETVAFVLQELGYTSCHFVGHSFGDVRFNLAIEISVHRQVVHLGHVLHAHPKLDLALRLHVLHGHDKQYFSFGDWWGCLSENLVTIVGCFSLWWADRDCFRHWFFQKKQNKKQKRDIKPFVNYIAPCQTMT